MTPQAVDLETLKGLYADQSAKLMENTRMAVSDMMNTVREEFDLQNRALKEEVKGTNSKMQAMDHRLQQLVGRVETLERRGPSGPAVTGAIPAAADDRHKYTLVYGGWPRIYPQTHLDTVECSAGQTRPGGHDRHHCLYNGPTKIAGTSNFCCAG